MTTRTATLTRSDLRTELSDYALDLALRTGTFTEAFPRILARGPAPLDPLTTAAAALRWAGPDAVLCGPTAAWLWGCATARSPDVHVLRGDGRNRCAPAGIVLHSGPLTAADTTTVATLPVLRRDRTIADLLCTPDHPPHFVIADEAMSLTPAADRPRFRAAIHTALTTRRDPRGVHRAHHLTDLLTGTGSPHQSELLLTLATHHYPIPRHNHPVTDHAARELYRLQFAWPRHRVAAEVDGPPPDPLRDSDLTHRGWRLVRAPTPAAILDRLPALGIHPNPHTSRRQPL